MTRRILAAAFLGMVFGASGLVIAGCTENPIQTEPDVVSVLSPEAILEPSAARGATQPLWATVNVDFNLGFFADPTQPSWVGTLTVDTEDYGIVFWSIGSGKPFANGFRGSAMFFEEIWGVYTWVDFDFVNQTLAVGDLLMSGRNAGVSTRNGKFRGNGVVEEAFAGMSMWEGRHVHEAGRIAFNPDGSPHSATGVFRVN
jgi:hypothetical protein